MNYWLNKNPLCFTRLFGLSIVEAAKIAAEAGYEIVNWEQADKPKTIAVDFVNDKIVAVKGVAPGK